MRGLAQIGESNFTDDDENDFFKTMDYFSANKMEFWATYEHSFMIGNMMNMLQAGFGSLASSILATLAPETMFWLASRQDHGESSNGGGSSHFGEYYIIPKNMYNFIMAVVQNISTYDCDGTVCSGPKPNEPSNLYKALQHLKQNNPKLYESVNKMFGHIKNDVMISVGGMIELKMADILPLTFQIMFPDLGSPKDNDPRWEQRVYFSDYKTKLLSVTQYFLNNVSKSTSVNKHIQGYEFGTYGYGLGLYFISISLWIGAITQTFIYRKKSYTPNAKWYQQYEILGCFGALMVFLVVFLGIGLGTAYIYRRIEMFGTFSLKEIYETMDNIDATKEFVRSRRVINNLSVEYALLIKEYIDEKHREQKIKDLEDKINSLYKDLAVVRIKKLEAMLEVYRNRFEIIKQKYVILT
ncbi:hypothetical protein [Spiroplasma endosymbiont of Glossina fuscipes fuscipes]|uniref:hypothetical protein n=1 Tax=Spiroplasma endosymbiont of Glossina fuscipes fuscipes TaxID=2004463 RepID=UPI003C7557B1